MMALELGRSSRVHDTVAYKRVAFGVKLRLYPHGFTDDEFKPLIEKNRGFETTLGFTFSIIVKKK